MPEAEKPPAQAPARDQREHRVMAGQDAELDLFRQEVNCAAVLEQLPPAWTLDRKESTRRALKYRRGEGEVVIVNHEGRGWWDPQSQAKGDVFDLVQHLDPSLNFGQVRRVLRRFVGVAPTLPNAPPRARRAGPPPGSLPERWRDRPRLRRGSPVWDYLTGTRGLPPTVLTVADTVDVVREGFFGSAWFAHRDQAGQVRHVEIRGPDFRGSLRGGHKTLFHLPAAQAPAPRLAVVEAPIDALSLAALEGGRPDTAYIATGGGIGPGTQQAIEILLDAMRHIPNALLVGATDANLAGDRYADHHAETAAAAGVRFQRLRPEGQVDWNDVLKAGRAP